jgi:hypothetical protein
MQVLDLEHEYDDIARRFTAVASARRRSPSPMKDLIGNSSKADLERRKGLRGFLTCCRARLRPSDVGLPETSRRRVAGLRREEVAELIGVSSDWYRSLESGREVRVSPQLVARLARVLRLNAREELTIYGLALPELYRLITRCARGSEEGSP